jgi:hypothetical protein
MLSSKSFDNIITLATLMSPVDNYAQYQQHLRQRVSASVPFLGVTLSDISFIEDFNLTKLPAGLNFAKASQMNDIIEPICHYQVLISSPVVSLSCPVDLRC